MKIIVHRGTRQIGGCCTEISTDRARILIDYGMSLPGGDSEHLRILMDEKSDTQKTTAVLISHYHGDHVGEIGFVPEHIPVYMGTVAKQLLMLYKQHQPHSYQFLNPDSIAEFGDGSFPIGDITVTPIPSDHSAFDSYMFLIEGDGKRVLHTGDYRLHGPRREKLMERLAACCKNVDMLITEGTTLSRSGSDGYTEETVESQIRKLSGRYKYCFVLCSSGNIDRIAAVGNSVVRGRYFLMDTFQKSLLELVKAKNAEYASCFQKALSYGVNLAEKAEERGFTMLVRANASFEKIVKYYAGKYPGDVCLVYSMWCGYREHKPIARLCSLTGNCYTAHSSGHVSIDDVNRLINILLPDKVLFIHTDSEHPGEGIDRKDRIVNIKDRQEYTL